MINTIFGANIEPISILFLVLVQIGGRYLRFELTNAQQKIINSPLFQTIILFSVILMATKNVITSIIIVVLTYLFIYVLFNENHKYNILSKKWLKDEKLISDSSYTSLKDIYYKNIISILK
jgi:Ca2+/Na+ antiporter